MANANHSYQSFISDSHQALASYPGLVLIENEIPELTGAIALRNEHGEEIDRYEVRVVATAGYPYFFPTVFETGGKIPINEDWHVFETDGHLCLCTLTDEFLKTTNGLPLLRFLKEELEPYLFNQTLRKTTGFFSNEMPHGEKGQLKALKTLLKTDDVTNISWLLRKAIEDYKMDRTSLCFCGSGVKYRHCHRDILQSFKDIGNNKLTRLVNYVESTYEYKFAIGP